MVGPSTGTPNKPKTIRNRKNTMVRTGNYFSNVSEGDRAAGNAFNLSGVYSGPPDQGTKAAHRVGKTMYDVAKITTRNKRITPMSSGGGRGGITTRKPASKPNTSRALGMTRTPMQKRQGAKSGIRKANPGYSVAYKTPWHKGNTRKTKVR